VRLIITYSTGRTTTGMMRGLVNGERRIIVSCPWRQPAAVTLAEIADRLTAEEMAVVRTAFGLGEPESPPRRPLSSSGP
jgi:hypothetical protein